jgi:hypothetical protein
VEKGGLSQALVAKGLKAGQVIVWADEMRVGLIGQLRRRWLPRGVKLRQKLELKYVWRYLVLAVDPIKGRLWWRWVERLRKESIFEVLKWFKAEGIEAVIWDNAPGHTAGLIRACGVPTVNLPPYSPELNPVERIFEELRRQIEGKVYGQIELKVEAAELLLKALTADPSRVKRLTGWPWITDALLSLPA